LVLVDVAPPTEVGETTRTSREIAAALLATANVTTGVLRRRVRHRRLRRALRRACCRRGRSCICGPRVPGERDVLTVVALGGDSRLVALVGAVSRLLDYEVEIMGVAPSMALWTSSLLPPVDVLESSAAASLSRGFKLMEGHCPEWDVLHGRSAGHALAGYVDERRPKLVALAHRPHRRGRRCETLRILWRIPSAVLVAVDGDVLTAPRSGS
jgi:hypothetical protein